MTDIRGECWSLIGDTDEPFQFIDMPKHSSAAVRCAHFIRDRFDAAQRGVNREAITVEKLCDLIDREFDGVLETVQFAQRLAEDQMSYRPGLLVTPSQIREGRDRANRTLQNVDKRIEVKSGEED